MEKEYDVTIVAKVRKTIRVKSASEYDAIEKAHSLFSATPDDNPESYSEDCETCDEVKI